MNPERDPKFSVLIVNYNGGEYLQNAIDSLVRQSFRNFEVIVIDNDSEDSSFERINVDKLQSCTLKKMTENLGFAKANNLAATIAKGEWLALLNPDAEADENWLLEMDAAVQEHDLISVFASKQILMDDSDRLDGAGDAYLAFGFPWRSGYLRLVPAELKTSLCFSACGASAVYLRSLFIDHGGFDERFFCYCEDVDLGFRLQLSGEDCLFVSDAIIRHKGGVSSDAHRGFRTYFGNRNQIWLYLKNMPTILLALTLPGFIALLGYIYIRNRRTFSDDSMYRAIKDGFKHGFRMRREVAYRTLDRKLGLYRFAKRMSWNPWRMTRNDIHLRPTTLKTTSRR